MTPRLYSKADHQIMLDEIDNHALYILDKLYTAGHTAYLVGGSVRDLLLKKRPKDFDISTSARPEEIKKLFRNAILIGKRFRLAHIRFGRKIIEVSTFRSGDIEDERLIVRDNIWGNPEEDVLRRDFTINGLFYDSREEVIIDYVGGYEDLKRTKIQTIGHPYLRFKQDPVRMIRLLKFKARFGFEIDPLSHQALIECRPEILKSSQARILEELLRMLELGSAKPFYQLMTEYGLLQMLMPELSAFLETGNGEEVFDLLDEVDTMVKDPKDTPPDRVVALSCLIYPLLTHHLDIHAREKGHPPHLGIIQEESRHILDRIFRPFFHLSKRLRTELLFIATAQFRFHPPEGKKRKIRVPRIPDFHLALDFLKVRARLEPALLDTYTLWNSQYEKMGKTPSHRRRR